MDEIISWLLEGDPWVVYGTRLHLLKQDTSDPEVVLARRLMVEHPFVRTLIAELQEWPGYAISSHKSAGQLFHKLAFAAQLGLARDDPGMALVIERVLAHQDPEGPFQLRSNTPVHFGGTGEDIYSWALCDAPLVLYALVRFGLADDPRVRRGVDHLVNLARENGWPCAVSQELGSFRGPGRKEDPCPFATLIMLRLLASLPDLRDSEPARRGAASLLNLWKNRRDKHPYIFYMGTDFCKIKYPLIWYDILHVTSVLAGFPWLAADPRLTDMRAIIRSKADREGKYTIESAWMAWKDWEFGQKKTPSRALTLKVLRTTT